ncbi:DNA fragmentation factor subunit beta isoform X1 [Gallus gallus]|uniref:DNA fragmentation factor subunit beta n=1 Tax=Gallus gallus TaxID=9031 RepID=A0A8V0ZPI3_CHICK|nr:DNA fragmentation factor subunit beta isoform X1 [Gallus gallus]XP_046787075.1 DNA fragmentation factor subunit beta isoform X1 [Gallus gallus]
MAAPLRGFRLRRPGSAQKFGAAAGSLRGLLRKGCRLLQLPLAGSRLCLYEDGTELSEAFFRTLPPQTELVLLRPGESWPGCCGDVERFLAALCSRTDAVVEAARRLLEDERAPRRQRLLADLIHNLSGDSAAERRDEDGKWFEGLESRFKNKSSYMRYSCESRIRSYMKEVSNFISNVHPTARDAYKRILDLMSDKLKSVKYNGSYFDRTEEEAAMRLCTKEGWFSCQGPFDRDDCPCKHSINPYTNRESRILFSTWNLDHMYQQVCSAPNGTSSPCQAHRVAGASLQLLGNRRSPAWFTFCTYFAELYPAHPFEPSLGRALPFSTAMPTRLLQPHPKANPQHISCQRVVATCATLSL